MSPFNPTLFLKSAPDATVAPAAPVAPEKPVTPVEKLDFTPINLSQSVVEAAYATIVDLGLDRITCSLTGAPYATLDAREIEETLTADWMLDPLNDDSLVDRWELRHWTMCSRPAPSLRLADTGTLSRLLAVSKDGRVKALSFTLGRLLFPASDSDAITQEKYHFLREFYRKAEADWSATHNQILEQLLVIDGIQHFQFWYQHVAWTREFRQELQFLANTPPDDSCFITLVLEMSSRMHAWVMDWLGKTDSFDPTKRNMSSTRAVVTTAEQAERLTILAAPIWELKRVAREKLVASIAGDDGPRVAKSVIGSISDSGKKRKGAKERLADIKKAKARESKPINPTRKAIKDAISLLDFSGLGK